MKTKMGIIIAPAIVLVVSMLAVAGVYAYTSSFSDTIESSNASIEYVEVFGCDLAYPRTIVTLKLDAVSSPTGVTYQLHDPYVIEGQLGSISCRYVNSTPSSPSSNNYRLNIEVLPVALGSNEFSVLDTLPTSENIKLMSGTDSWVDGDTIVVSKIAKTYDVYFFGLCSRTTYPYIDGTLVYPGFNVVITLTNDQ